MSGHFCLKQSGCTRKYLGFKPLSDEWETCVNDLQKYKIDFELLERGTYEEHKEVIDKYGR
jgi:hypothetical protein